MSPILSCRKAAVRYISTKYHTLERASVCDRVRWKLKNGPKLGCHDAQSLAMDEDFVEVVALLLFVN